MTWFLLATVSALLSAFSAVLQKRILFRLHALEFSFAVSMSIVILSVFIPLTNDVTSVSSAAMMIIIAKSILGGSAFLLVMLSLQYNDISSALPLLGLTPAATALFSLIILGEALQTVEWFGIALMIAGVFMLERRKTDSPNAPSVAGLQMKKYAYIAGAVILFAVSSVYDRLLVSGLAVNPLVVLFFQHAVYAALFASFIIIRRTPFSSLLPRFREQLPFILLAAVLTLAYRYTQLEATKLAPVALVLAVKRTSILYASFLGGKFFSEERLTRKLLGALLIVAAGFLILRNVG